MPAQTPMDLDDETFGPPPSLPIFWRAQGNADCFVCECLEEYLVVKEDLDICITALLCSMDTTEERVGRTALSWLVTQLENHRVSTDIISMLDGSHIAFHVAQCLKNPRIMSTRVYTMMGTLMCDQLQEMTNASGRISKDSVKNLKDIHDMYLKNHAAAEKNWVWAQGQRKRIKTNQPISSLPTSM